MFPLSDRRPTMSGYPIEYTLEGSVNAPLALPNNEFIDDPSIVRLNAPVMFLIPSGAVPEIKGL